MRKYNVAYWVRINHKNHLMTYATAAHFVKQMTNDGTIVLGDAEIITDDEMSKLIETNLRDFPEAHN